MKRCLALLAALCTTVACKVAEDPDPRPGKTAERICQEDFALTVREHEARSPDPTATVTFEQILDAFTGDPVPSDPDMFTMTAADMDLDGDLDVLINRHLLSPIEIFENTPAGFVQLNPIADDRSGVYDNRGIPSFYAESDQMLSELADVVEPGMYVWHDPNRSGEWNVYTIPAAGSCDIDIRVNRPLIGFPGLLAAELDKIDAFNATVTLGPTRRHFQISNELIGTQLAISVDTLPIFVGPDKLSMPPGEVSLWKPDPHGVAWVDVLGSPEPELFVTRGGLIGNLLPPHDPKTDQLFEYVAGSTVYEQVAEGVIPSNYGRGRQLSWVDADNDCSDELYVSNTLTNNQLLDDEGSGTFADRAPELGIDYLEDDSFVWYDLDNDGWLDIITNTGADFFVSYNGGQDGFRQAAGASIGLVSPLTPEEVAEGIFNPLAIALSDYDRDGDLDLWASGFGPEFRVALYRRDGEVFTDVTAEVGLSEEKGVRTLLVMDVDNDGLQDAVIGGPTFSWWRNDNAETFAPVSLQQDLEVAVNRVLLPGDFDGDGWLDLITSNANHGTRQFLHNVSTGANHAVTVDIDAPRGAQITGYYADDSQLLQQWGVAASNRFSQGTRPVHFGVGEVDLVRIGIRWPGDLEDRMAVDL